MVNALASSACGSNVTKKAYTCQPQGKCNPLIITIPFLAPLRVSFHKTQLHEARWLWFTEGSLEDGIQHGSL